MIQDVDVSWPQQNYHPGAECGVIVAATSGDGGKLFTQTTYRQDVANARAAGKEVGFYHFNGNVDPVQSADYFWSVIKGDIRPGDIVVLDVESSQGGRFPAVSPAWAAAFSTRLAQLRGLSVAQSRLGIYGNRSDMHAPGWGALERSGSWLYLASPGGYPENTPVGEWSHWTILQYSSAGGVDRDESEQTFAAIAGTPTKKEEDEMPRYIRNNTTGTIAIGVLGVFHVELPNLDYVALLDGWKLWDRTQDLNLPGNVYDFVKSWPAAASTAPQVGDITAAVQAVLAKAGTTVDADAVAASVWAAIAPHLATIPAEVVAAEGKKLTA